LAFVASLPRSLALDFSVNEQAFDEYNAQSIKL